MRQRQIQGSLLYAKEGVLIEFPDRTRKYLASISLPSFTKSWIRHWVQDIDKGPFSVPIPVEMKLTNPSSQRISFKIKTTTPKQYAVKPSCGIVEPEGVVSVIITLHPFQYDAGTKYSHKFLVQSVVIPDDPSVNLDELWQVATREQTTMDSKLRCLLIDDSNVQTTTAGPVKNFDEQEQQRLLAENRKLKAEGAKLRQMIILEQDRTVAVKEGRWSCQEIFRNVIGALIFLLIGVVSGLWASRSGVL